MTRPTPSRERIEEIRRIYAAQRAVYPYVTDLLAAYDAVCAERDEARKYYGPAGLRAVSEFIAERDAARAALATAVEALELIAAPKRADGTYNRCREACEELARATLAKLRGGEG